MGSTSKALKFFSYVVAISYAVAVSYIIALLNLF